uniref:Uncharacterized protein n=1 Tax=Rhizophora mucronata TaxID=61149 RepID=A0A2P2N612_RHIMU
MSLESFVVCIFYFLVLVFLQFLSDMYIWPCVPFS